MNPYRRDWADVESATYSEPDLPHYRGNPLISALPVQGGDEALLRALKCDPLFHPDQRRLDTYKRMEMLKTLATFMVPMQRHLSLARYIEATLRQGYVGREPNTPSYIAKLNEIHRQRRDEFTPVMGNTGASLAGALIGLSGTAKTTALRLIQTLYPRVISHSDLGIEQIPFVPMDFPADGHSVRGPILSICRYIERWLPDTQYATRLLRKNMTVSQLLAEAKSVLLRHYVGMLIADEVQNSQNAPKDKAYLAALLVQLSNELGMPILFVGTNNAIGVLSNTLASTRRSLTPGLTYWDRYLWHEPRPDGAPIPGDEWTPFFKGLWRQQWLRNPVPYSPYLSKVVHDECQGVPDLAIKLFHMSQHAAMLDGTETLSPSLIMAVAGKELASIAQMLEAIRTGNPELLARHDDLRPLRLRAGNFGPEFWASPETTVRGAGIKADHAAFAPSIADSLQGVGVPAHASHELAARVAEEHPRANAVQGLRIALGKLGGKRPVKSKLEPDKLQVALDDLTLAEDLRQGLKRASANKSSVVDELKAMGVIPNLYEIFELT